MSTNLRIAAELVLNNQGFEAGVARSSSLLERLTGAGGRAGEMFGKMALDMGKATGALLLANRVWDGWISRAEKAVELAARTYDIKMSLTVEGDKAEDIEKRLADFQALALDVSISASGNKADLLAAFAAGLDSGIRPDVMKASLGRVGSNYADASKQFGLEGKRGAFEQINAFSAAYGFTDEKNMSRVADLLLKGTYSSSYGGSVPRFAKELGIAAKPAQQAGLSPEDLTTWMTLIGDIRDEGEGTALRSGLNILYAKKKDVLKADRRMAGMFDEGGQLKDLDTVAKTLTTVFGSMKPGKALEVMSQLFGTEGAVAFQALIGRDAGERGRVIAAKPGVATRQEELGKTPGFRRDSAVGTLESATTEAMKPAADWIGGFWKAANDTIITPLAKTMSGSPEAQKLVSGAGLLGAGALGVGGLFLGGRGLMYGVRGLKEMGTASITPDVVSIAKAKALEKTLGIQPVSVVNWDELLFKLGYMGKNAGMLPGVAQAGGYRPPMLGGGAVPMLPGPGGTFVAAPAKSWLGAARAIAMTPVGKAGAGLVSGAVGVGAAIGEFVGTSANKFSERAGDEFMPNDRVRRVVGENDWADRYLFGRQTGQRLGEHQFNAFELAGARIGSFFGSDSMTRLLAEREALRGGSTYEGAQKAGDAAVAESNGRAAEKMETAAASLETSSQYIFESARRLEYAATLYDRGA